MCLTLQQATALVHVVATGSTREREELQSLLEAEAGHGSAVLLLHSVGQSKSHRLGQIQGEEE